MRKFVTTGRTREFALDADGERIMSIDRVAQPAGLPVGYTGTTFTLHGLDGKVLREAVTADASERRWS